jgi:hypothetical protein
MSHIYMYDGETRNSFVDQALWYVEVPCKMILGRPELLFQ